LAAPRASDTNRFKQIYDGKIPRPPNTLTLKKALRASGLSPQKIRYNRDVSERVENDVLDLKKLSLSPSEEVVKDWNDVKGMEDGNAEMFLIFV